MSAYIQLRTPMTDRACLLEALAELGFGADKVEVHEGPVQLVGYEGSRRATQAHVVIRRQHVGAASNDVGFLETPTGYQAQVSDYDRGRFGEAWLGALHARYQARWADKQARLAEAERQRLEAERRALVEAQRVSVRERAKELGYRVKETREGETIRLVLVKRSY